MNLLIDAGNTRIKWAVETKNEWVSSGALPVEQVSMLSKNIGDLENIEKVWVSNVAGKEVAENIKKLKNKGLHFITAQQTQCGLSNGYKNVDELGSDRWAAMIAAWEIVCGKCLVVNCGTATTVDAISGKGEFLGGLIIPGFDLMKNSLAGAAKQLQASSGIYAQFPANTADAIYSGAIQASCGAVDRQKALFGDEDVTVILSGGSAEQLQPYLGRSTRVVDNLVLRGLQRIALENA